MNYELTHLCPISTFIPFELQVTCIFTLYFPLPHYIMYQSYTSLYLVIMGSKEEAEKWKHLSSLHKCEE